jgi:hypothetical protein
MEKVNGSQAKALSVTCTREIIAKIRSMDMEFLHGQVEISTRVNIKKMKEKDMVK